MRRRTIRVFEYERIAVGRPIQTVEGGDTTLSVGELEALVRFADSRRERVLEAGFRSVRFRNFVGYLQLDTLGIEVLPKADRRASRWGGKDRWHDALLQMLRVIGRVPSMVSADAYVARRGGTLLDVYVAQLLDEIEALIHVGLARTYRTREENTTTFKGRLMVERQVRENAVHAERFFVARNAYDGDHLINQILVAALDVVGRSSVRPSLAHRARSLREAMPSVRSRPVRAATFDRIRLGRKTERYRQALELARLVLLDQAPQLRAGDLEVLSILFDMNAVWEEYVAVLLRRAAPRRARVTTQVSRRFWRAPGGGRSLRPDLVLWSAESDTPIAVLDTKWKLPNNGRPSDNDLRQMFAYNELLGCQRAVLLYPAAGASPSPVSGRFEAGGSTCETHYFSIVDGDPAASAATLLERLLPATV